MAKDVEINIDEERINTKINNGVEAAQKRLDSQVLKDSNYYCPLDSSMLQKSAITHTVIGSGLIVWRTPYAREQYYNKPNKSHDKNPNASCKWFELAKAKQVKLWEKIADAEFSKNYK